MNFLKIIKNIEEMGKALIDCELDTCEGCENQGVCLNYTRKSLGNFMIIFTNFINAGLKKDILKMAKKVLKAQEKQESMENYHT